MVRIKEIQVDRFGVWNTLQISDLPDQLTVFYGPNEAGKTTLMQFVRSVLYGFSPERREQYAAAGAAGGSLLVESSQGLLRLTRRVAEDDGPTSAGKLEIHSADQSPRNRELLPQLLAGVDETTFNNVFAVGLRELQELGTLDATEAAQLLYNLTSGLDRVSLMAVLQELEHSRNAILRADSELEQLLGQRDRLRADLASLGARDRQWFESAAQLAQVRDDLVSQQRSIEQLKQDIGSLRSALPIRALWEQRQQQQQQLEQWESGRIVAADAVERIESMERELTQLRQKRAEHRKHRAQLKQEAQALPLNRRLLDAATQVSTLHEKLAWMEALEQQVAQLRARLGAPPTPGTLASLPPVSAPIPAGASGTSAIGAALESPQPQVTERVVASLREPARAVRSASQALKQAQREQQRSLQHAEQCSDRLENELVERGANSLQRALDKAGTAVSRLRRRIQVEERLDKMLRHRDDLEEESEHLLDEHVLPLAGLMWPAAMFIVGFTMLLSGMFFEELLNLGGYVSLLGVVAVAVAVLWKVNVDRRSSQEMDNNSRQLRSLNEQIRQTQDERDELDRQLPTGGGALDSRLATAEGELEHLQSLVPLDADRQAADQRGSSAERKVESAAEALRDARSRWRAALRRHKLPDTLKPSELRELAEQTEQQLLAQRELDAQRQELEARERELLGFRGRTQQLLQQCRIKPASDDPRQQLQQLADALDQQQSLLQRRGELAARHKRHGRQLKSIAKAGRRLIGRWQSLLDELGVADQQELRELDERRQQAELLRQEIAQQTQLLESELDDLGPARAAVAELVESTSSADLDARCKKREAELADAQAQHARLHQRKGALQQELQSAGSDTRQDRLRLELAGLDQQLDGRVRQWRVLNVASQVLHKLRHDYENERQPETLNQASQFLTQLTEGRYTRIWTPFGEAALRIDSQDGSSAPLHKLSAGTREAVFVCLRLALAASFSRRGAMLPLVLDDVLVNFDVTRAAAAAAVLRDFSARGHQMLLFTCHEHIMQAFQEAGAEIRVLPGRGAEQLREYEQRKKQKQQPAAEPAPPPARPKRARPKPPVRVVAPDPQPAPPKPAPSPKPALPEVVQTPVAAAQESVELPAEEPPAEEPMDNRQDFWKAFWFEGDEIQQLAPPPEPPAPAGTPVWEAAEMWWEGEPDPAPRRSAVSLGP